MSQDAQNLAVVIEDLLQNMQTRFSDLSQDLLNKLDEMSVRIDSLEKTLNELVTQADMEADSEKRA